MPPYTTCCFAHEHAMAMMFYDDDSGFVLMSLDAFIEVNDDSEYVARFPAFAGRLGIADSREDALDSLRAVVEEWVTLFLEHNDIAEFQKYLLEECSFHLLSRPFKPAPHESEGAEQALLNVRFPAHVHNDGVQ